MNKTERIELLELAQEKLFEVIELIEEAIEGTEIETNTKTYLINHFNIMATSNHNFLSGDLNIDEVIEKI